MIPTLRFAMAWALVWGATMAPAGSPPLQIRLDLGITHQVMEGFGSSSRVWDDPHLADAPQTVIPDAARAQILGLLYRDLGLTRVRPVLDGGVEPVNDNADPVRSIGASFASRASATTLMWSSCARLERTAFACIFPRRSRWNPG